jgi:hypothetical protein
MEKCPCQVQGFDNGEALVEEALPDNEDDGAKLLRYEAALAAARARLFAELAEVEGWEQTAEDKGVRVHTRPREGSDMTVSELAPPPPAHTRNTHRQDLYCHPLAAATPLPPAPPPPPPRALLTVQRTAQLTAPQLTPPNSPPNPPPPPSSPPNSLPFSLLSRVVAIGIGIAR